MLIKKVSSLLLFCLVIFVQKASACGLHGIYIDPNEFGVIGGAAIRMVGLAPPEPVFKITHRSMAKVALGEESNITVEYERPWFSRDVRMELTSTGGVSLEQSSIELDSFDGVVNVRFSLDKPGYNNIKLKVTGIHKGEQVERSSVIYVQAKKPASS